MNNVVFQIDQCTLLQFNSEGGTKLKLCSKWTFKGSNLLKIKQKVDFWHFQGDLNRFHSILGLFFKSLIRYWFAASMPNFARISFLGLNRCVSGQIYTTSSKELMFDTLMEIRSGFIAFRAIFWFLIRYQFAASMPNFAHISFFGLNRHIEG